MDIISKTEITIAPGLIVQELAQINNAHEKDENGHHFVQIGDGSSEDFRLPLNNSEQFQTFYDFYDALGKIVEKLRGWS